MSHFLTKPLLSRRQLQQREGSREAKRRKRAFLAANPPSLQPIFGGPGLPSLIAPDGTVLHVGRDDV